MRRDRIGDDPRPRQDGVIHQQLIEQLTREIMNYDAEYRHEDAGAVTVFRDTLSEGFSHFVTSMTAPVASGWSVPRRRHLWSRPIPGRFRPPRSQKLVDKRADFW